MKSALIDIPSTLVVEVNPLGQTFEVDSFHEWVDCPDDITAGNYNYINGQFVPVPPPAPPTAEENKEFASKLLYETDWTTIPDVADSTKSNPYLDNAQDFVAYRNSVRQIAINPTEGYVQWASKPTAIWKTT
jgi:hypothetical protein